MKIPPQRPPNDEYKDYDKIYEKIETLQSNYQDNPHLVQMTGEDHGYIIEVYFYSNPSYRDYFWVKSLELMEMAVKLSRQHHIVKCNEPSCDWERRIEVFVAEKFLKKIRFNNMPNIGYSATLEHPILPKNKIHEFVMYELNRHMRENHGVPPRNNDSQDQQEIQSSGNVE